MTIQDYGSMGELIAAIATVITLVYLSIQIRANTRALKLESRRAEFSSAGAFTDTIIGNEDVARLFRDGLADPGSLSDVDLTRFCFLLGRYVGTEAGQYDEVRLGAAPAESLERRKRTLSSFLLTPGGRFFWTRFAQTYPDDFQLWVVSDIFGGDAP